MLPYLCAEKSTTDTLHVVLDADVLVNWKHSTLSLIISLMHSFIQLHQRFFLSISLVCSLIASCLHLTKPSTFRQHILHQTDSTMWISAQFLAERLSITQIPSDWYTESILPLYSHITSIWLLAMSPRTLTSSSPSGEQDNVRPHYLLCVILKLSTCGLIVFLTALLPAVSDITSGLM